MMNSVDIEATGPGFSLAAQRETRRRTIDAVHAVAAQIRPGMLETDAVAGARELLGTMEMRKGWHRVLVRFGPNTVKGFDEPSEPGVRLRDNDVFFIDIGPIYNGVEGDAGDTFVVGSDPGHLAIQRDVRALWGDVRDRWFAEGRTGRALYEFAGQAAESRGWQLSLELTGHRLSEFPHRAHYDGTLDAVDITPAANRWVLEIAIAHPDGSYGAFYEDLLLDDQSV